MQRPFQPELKIRSEEFFLSAGETNAERELSLPLLTSKLIDIATAHANSLGIGNPDMPDANTGWVLSRLTIEMNDYPLIDETYRISTWVESWNRHFSERAFAIDGLDGQSKGFARSVWMVLNTDTHSNAGLQNLDFAEEYIADIDCPIPRQGKHALIVTAGEAGEAVGRCLIADEVTDWKFRYSDLDAYRHVNTVRYVQLLMNQFSLAMHDEYSVRRLELSFLNEGQYDEELQLLRLLLTPASGQTLSSQATEELDYAFLLRKKIDRIPIIFSKVSMRRRVRGIPALRER